MSQLGDRLRQRAQQDGTTPAVYARERWWTLGELVGVAERVARGLAVQRGDVVAIAIDRGIETAIALCATALANAIPAMLDPRDKGLAATTLATLAPAVVIVAPGDELLPGARVLDADGKLGAPAASSWTPIRRDTAISHIIFTSGSTAGSKGVVWSELRTGYDLITNRPRAFHREAPSAVVVPVCTSLGFHELLRSLHHGTSVVLVELPFVAALDELRTLGVNRIKLTPTHVELLLATAVELPDLRAISVASAPLTPERARLLAERAPNARVSRSYGLTESGAATTVWLRKNPGKMHTVGRPIGFRRVTVRDPEGRMLTPDQIGEVVIELPMWDACDGYLDPSPELARRFDNGVLWTGDRGAIDRHGFLVLGERQAELLKVGGRSVSAPRIEQTLHQLPNTRELVVVGVPDRWLGEVPCAVVVPEPGCDISELATTAARLAAEASRADDVPKWWLPRVELPRGPTNKIRRGELAREAAAWTTSFSQMITPEHRRFPAYDLEGGVTIVDGAPWSNDGAIDGRSRVITLAMRDPVRPLAFGVVRAERGARVIVGPVAVERPGEHVSDRLLGVFAGELVHLARRLPGPQPQAICVFGRATGTELVPIDGYPGWRWKREGAGDPLDSTNLDELASYLEILAAWAQRASAGTA